MSDEGGSLAEKRVYGETRETTVAYVASGLGLARVAIAGDQVGRIGLVHRGPVADVAGTAGRLLVATPDDVLVGTGEGFEATGFGPAVAVGVGTDCLLAAADGGRVARLRGDEWIDLGTVEAPRRFDGRYLAAGDGVHRLADGDLTALGLDAVVDVAAAGPFAATADGLYRREEAAWTRDRAGEARVVAATEGVAHLATADGLFERVGEEWAACHLPVDGAVADVAYGAAPVVATRDGTLLVDAAADSTPDGSGGWRHRALGLPDVAALSIP